MAKMCRDMGFLPYQNAAGLSSRCSECSLGDRMARLQLSTPDGQQVVDLAVHNSLGRHPTNSIQLLDKIVSKEHCIIDKRGAQFVLRDLGSLNGTYVNGERVNGEAPLRHGDEIALGGTRARLDDPPQGPINPQHVAMTQPQPS